jgi:hypothetical protein
MSCAKLGHDHDIVVAEAGFLSKVQKNNAISLNR